MLLFEMGWLIINRCLFFLIYSFVVIFCTAVSALGAILLIVHVTVISVDMTELQSGRYNKSTHLYVL